VLRVAAKVCCAACCVPQAALQAAALQVSHVLMSHVSWVYVSCVTGHVSSGVPCGSYSDVLYVMTHVMLFFMCHVSCNI
jgi:hypothetical protein